MRLGIAQTELAPESLDAALDALDATLAEAAAAGARLVLFPELYLCGYGDWARARALALPAGALAERLAPMAARARVGMCEHRGDLVRAVLDQLFQDRLNRLVLPPVHSRFSMVVEQLDGIPGPAAPVGACPGSGSAPQPMADFQT